MKLILSPGAIPGFSFGCNYAGLYICNPVGELAQLVERLHVPNAFGKDVSGLKVLGKGELAQLVERLHGMQEVSGSTPLFSTK